MTPERKDLVRQSWRLIDPSAEVAAQVFYDRLFELDPEARPLFAHVDMAAQGRKIMSMFAQIVATIDDPERFVVALATLGRRHVDYGARDRDYDSVGAALLFMLEHQLGPAFTPDTRDAWAEAYRTMAGVMRRAAARTPAANAE